MMDAAAAQMHDDGERSYGGSWVLVRRMIEQGKFKAWTYTPLAGGVLFSLATIALRSNMKAMAVTNGLIGVGTIAMANGVATTAIVKERSHKP
ncbi:hypothetical protein C2E20_5932 [Micractinium conductrix]|uniref:Uncharacterized protein n=1 Tax=Micractinium conductrix TaxID=554055 RepID=A0A2P6V9G0_9CHLO|nr:hypothetical protein C2E20_5932 [Micractinium conductrix]|eukprot:PSC70722.1 hypothetical protein C2E20_5932 [Micractinium conductrix]